MHSKIYQFSLTPIDVDDYVCPEMFYDSEFADYIGVSVSESSRKHYVEVIASCFKGIFDLDGGVLVFKGMGNFMDEWKNYIYELAKDIKDGSGNIDSFKLFRLRMAIQRTHLDICSRFYSDDITGYAAPAEEFVNFVSTLKPGTRIYIGEIIDFHF